MALFNNFPYTDLNDINLDYTLQKLESLYTRGEQLYSTLTTWQQATDAELEQWKAATESALALWKTQTENSIDNKIQLLTAAINASFTELRTQLEAHIAEIEVTAETAASNAASSAQQALNAASAASINNEQSKEWAIGETLEGDPVPSTNPAYENNAKYYADLLGQETEQIDTNTTDIADLKSAIENKPISKTYTLTTGRYIGNRQTVGGTPVLDTTAGKYCVIDISEAKDGGIFTLIIDSVSSNNNIATLYTDSNDIILKVNITYNPPNSQWVKLNPVTNKYEHSETILSNASKIYFSIYGGSSTATVSIKHADLTIKQVYVKSDGNDNNNGLSITTPFATLSRAMASGAQNINILSDLYDQISIDSDVNINGNGYTVYGDTVLTTEAYNSVLRAPYPADDRITNCYVNQTTPLTESGPVWKGALYNISCYADDKKLVPVEDIATCETTPNSCVWNDGYWYINATATRYSYTVKSSIISISGGKVNINDLTVKHAYGNIIDGSKCTVEINGCKVIGSVKSNCISVLDGHLLIQNTETAYSYNDGINTHGRGDSTIIDCYCHDCSDDGVSQHDHTVGAIIGGEFTGCGKGGISSPINSAKVNIYSAYIHDNTGTYSYGIYASNSSGTTQTFKIWNCVIKDNRIGIKIVGHQALAYGNKLAGNTTDVSTESGGTVTYLD